MAQRRTGERTKTIRKKHTYHGIPVVPGIAMGHVHLKFRETLVLSDRTITADDIEAEFECLQEAVRASKEQLMIARKKVADEIGEMEACIFDAHIAIVEDRSLMGKFRDQIKNTLKPAEVVVSTVVDGYYDTLRLVEDAHMRERATDIRDVGQRLLRNLAALRPDAAREDLDPDMLPKSSAKDIIFAEELFPSDIEQIAGDRVRGVICERGNDRGHVAVMLRAMGIPCVMGVDGLAGHVHDGDFVIVDGSGGHAVVSPRQEIIEQYKQSLVKLEAYQNELKSEVSLPSVTLDNVGINLMCNVGHVSEMALGDLYTAQGVGLYRTEFELMSRSTYPDEDKQCQIYSNMVRAANGKPVTFRTMDIGSDKHLPYLPMPQEENHALGIRSIRLAMAHEEYQLIQLRAILRAAVHGPVRLMFPFISCVEDIRAAKRMLRQAMRVLRERKVEHAPRVPIGMMVEVPAVALSLDKFVREVEFFSVGTNDLTQYVCAADRNQKEVAQWYNCHNPGMLTLLKHIVEVAQRHDREVTVCGEMAGEPMYTMFLLGIGVRELSMSAPQIPLVKKIIRSVDLSGAQSLAARAMELPTTERVGDLFNRSVEKILGRDIKRF